MMSSRFSRREALRFAAGSCSLGLFTVGGALPAWPEVPSPKQHIRYGLIGPVGPQGKPIPSPKGKGRWDITQAGVYENYLIDLEFADTDAVRIRADNTIMRNCELRNGSRDAIEVYADDVLIENCRIRYFLAGSFKDQKDG